MNDDVNKPLDRSAVDRDFQIFRDKCAKAGKTPLEFGAWFMLDMTEEDWLSQPQNAPKPEAG